jgi:hypothetical protein
MQSKPVPARTGPPRLLASSADLQSVEVAVHGWAGYVAGEDLYTEIATTLSGLIEERAEVAGLPRGRTFAPRLQ